MCGLLMLASWLVSSLAWLALRIQRRRQSYVEL